MGKKHAKNRLFKKSKEWIIWLRQERVFFFFGLILLLVFISALLFTAIEWEHHAELPFWHRVLRNLYWTGANTTPIIGGAES